MCAGYSWDLRAAKVVCRQLGFEWASKTSTSAEYGRGTGKIWIDNVRCTGQERSLTECSHRAWGNNNCGHQNDVGVVCNYTGNKHLSWFASIIYHLKACFQAHHLFISTDVNTFLSPARLVYGNVHGEGLVQVYYSKSWIWVCADQWDKQDADVACRMMDFDGSLSTNFEYSGNKRHDQVWLNNMQCTGNEPTLLLCGHDMSVGSECKGKRKAGVKCKPKGKVKLELQVTTKTEWKCLKHYKTFSVFTLKFFFDWESNGEFVILSVSPGPSSILVSTYHPITLNYQCNNQLTRSFFI